MSSLPAPTPLVFYETLLEFVKSKAPVFFRCRRFEVGDFYEITGKVICVKSSTVPNRVPTKPNVKVYEIEIATSSSARHGGNMVLNFEEDTGILYAIGIYFSDREKRSIQHQQRCVVTHCLDATNLPVYQRIGIQFLEQ